MSHATIKTRVQLYLGFGLLDLGRVTLGLDQIDGLLVVAED